MFLVSRLSATLLGREFQVAGAEQRNARLANAGERFAQSSGHGSWPSVESARCHVACSDVTTRYAGVDVVRTLYVSIPLREKRDSMGRLKSREWKTRHHIAWVEKTRDCQHRTAKM